MSNKLIIKAGQLSKAGVKEHNEDSCGILIPDDELLGTKGVASVVADGVSSCEGGREASESCVLAFLNDYYSTPGIWSVKKSGEKVLSALNSWLYGKGLKRYGTEFEMVSTLSALVIKSASAHIFHVGDTRIHRLRGGQLECLTRDHIRRLSSQKNVLNRAVGVDINIHIDYQSTSVEEGDLFLLTTDGVHEYTEKKELKAILRDNMEEPEQAARLIVQQALDKGSQDNVTCQVLVVNELPNLSDEEISLQLTELPLPPPLKEGMAFEGYRMLRELNTRKRTQAYLALDKENGDEVVINTPSVNCEDVPEYIDSFIQEEWVGRRIDNQHVLKVIEPHRQRRYLYYVVEHVKGQSLRQWMQDNPKPSLSEVRKITEQITIGLQEFHRRGILHRDIKPENIMIDLHGTVKIIDFGSTRVAGLMEITKPIEQRLTQVTLNYAAPEYFQGFNGTECSDLYSLGVITYEMLTGKWPYGARESFGSGKYLHYRPARYYNSEIPVWIDGAIERAVKMDAKTRYNTLADFTYDLSNPNSDFMKTAPLLERNPVAFWRGLAIILIFAVLILL